MNEWNPDHYAFQRKSGINAWQFPREKSPDRWVLLGACLAGLCALLIVALGG